MQLSFVNSARWLLGGDRMTRGDFAKRIGISEKTIWRWEKNIILKWKKIKAQYYPDGKRNWLDDYQKILIIWINAQKKQGKTNDEIWIELKDYEDLTRQDLNSYLEENSHVTC